MRIQEEVDLLYFGKTEYHDIITPLITSINHTVIQICGLVRFKDIEHIDNPSKFSENNINMGTTLVGPHRQT